MAINFEVPWIMRVLPIQPSTTSVMVDDGRVLWLGWYLGWWNAVRRPTTPIGRCSACRWASVNSGTDSRCRSASSTPCGVYVELPPTLSECSASRASGRVSRRFDNSSRSTQVSSATSMLFCRHSFELSTQIRYDTIYLRALKSWRYGQLSLAHVT